jgi:membrane protease YdiL (CAAX protease family)
MAIIDRRVAATDVVILVAVVAAFWSLRFFGIRFIGVISMAAGIVTVLLLLRWRRQSLASIGWTGRFRGRALVSRVMEVMGVIGAAMLLAGALAGAMFGAPDKSTALTQQPESFWYFLLDATLLTWVFIAFGEELVFRGLLLSRLEALFGLDGYMSILVPAFAQGVIFGAGHASQGLTGMVITGTIGTAMAVYLVTRGERSLIPLVIAHGTIDTIALTAHWISR